MTRINLAARFRLAGSQLRLALAQRLFAPERKQWEAQTNALRAANLRKTEDMRAIDNLRAHELDVWEKRLNVRADELRVTEQRLHGLIEQAEQFARRKELLSQLEVCESKIPYQTQEAGEYAALALYYLDKRCLRVYRCPCCLRFHLTHCESLPVALKHRLVDQEVKKRLSASIGELVEWKQDNPKGR